MFLSSQPRKNIQRHTTKESKLTHRKGRRYLFPCHLDSQLEIQGYITHPMNKLEYRSRKSSGERTEHKNQISNCLCQLTRNKDKRYPKKNNRNRLRKNGRCTASAQTRTNKVITIWSLIWYIKNPNQQNILLSSQPRRKKYHVRGCVTRSPLFGRAAAIRTPN